MNRYQDSVSDFSSEEAVSEILESINTLEMKLTEKWKIKSRIIDFEQLSVQVPNGTEGDKYDYTFPSNFFSDNHIKTHEILGLEDTGLSYQKETTRLLGKPTINGTISIHIHYNIEGESDDVEPHTKEVNLIINPDPKTLWKNIPSDTDALFWKEDNRSDSAKFGDKRIIVSSKRGRSHQNVGSFRDDDFSFRFFERTEWTVVAVADGAGSAYFSRKGSQEACATVIEFFEHEISLKDLLTFENELKASQSDEASTEDIERATVEAKKVLYKCTTAVHNKLQSIAKNTFNHHPDLFDKEQRSILDYFHSTLIFSAFKKFDFGYVFLSFGVGDCPIAVISKDKSEVHLLNYLDVGEFGGGTRFITQPDIFHSKERPMIGRFSLKIVDDFSHFFMMTDGIYDAKFIVEANLEKVEKWHEFLKDLEGDNEDGIGLGFSDDVKEEETLLHQWMDFWSKGNHDDRTLAIIY